jgi:hypothetical protein
MRNIRVIPAILILLCVILFGGVVRADSTDISASLGGRLISPTFISAELTTGETNRIDIYLFEPGVLNTSSFFVEHEEGAHERVDPLDEDFFLSPFTPCVDLSSSPYPYDTPLSFDKRNKRSTLPIYMSAVLRGIASSDGSLYFEKLGYEHRNLTIQEVDPLNPEDPNNSNPTYDIDDIIQNQGGILSVGTFQQGVERMFRICVYTKLRGDIDETGQVNINDLIFLVNKWLNDTYIDDEYVGNNCDVSDRNHDGLTDLLDFVIMSVDWLEVE